MSTLGSLAGLSGGLALGIWAHAHPETPVASFAKAMSPDGRVWVNALRMTVIPLVVSQLIVAVVAARGRAVGRMGGLAVASFVARMVTPGSKALEASLTVPLTVAFAD